jgi:hypothetical protein
MGEPLKGYNAGFLLDLLVDPEDGSNMLLRNVG